MADERLSVSIAAPDDPPTTRSSPAIDNFSTDGGQQDDGSEVWYNSVEHQENAHEDQGTMREQAAVPSVEIPSPLAPAEDNDATVQPLSTGTGQTYPSETLGQTGDDSHPLISPLQSPSSLTGSTHNPPQSMNTSPTDQDTKTPSHGEDAMTVAHGVIKPSNTSGKNNSDATPIVSDSPVTPRKHKSASQTQSSNTKHSARDESQSQESVSLEYRRLLVKIVEEIPKLKKRVTKLEESKEGSIPLNAVPDSKDNIAMSPEICITHLNSEQFKQSAPSFRNNPEKPGHSIANPPLRTSVIEVLFKDPHAAEPQSQRWRHITHPQSRGEPVISSHDIPERIRIRSTYLLNLLFDATGVRLDHGGSKDSVNERTSLVFLYPFKFFITYGGEIRRFAENLQRRLDVAIQDMRLPTDPESNETTDTISLDGATIATNVPSGSLEKLDNLKFESNKAFQPLQLLIQLFDEDLKPIFDLRDEYAKGQFEQVAFENLWLLFSLGTLVFDREPEKGHPPALARVSSVTGGRRLLNNDKLESFHSDNKYDPGENSKGRENRFCIRTYSLSFDGESYGPVDTSWSMPSWEGMRNVRDLKLFPVQYCKPGRDFDNERFPTFDDFKAHITGRGKKYIGLRNIAHKYYNGQIVGTQREQCQSHVVIDFEIQQRHLKADLPFFFSSLGPQKADHSKISSGLNIFPGDLREVQESTKRAQSTTECVIPGCDNNDFIHDDVALDEAVARKHITKYGITSAKFRSEDIKDKTLSDDDYAIFPTFVYGYVLNSRSWAKLDLDLLTDTGSTGSRFDELQLPEEVRKPLQAVLKVSGKDHPSKQIPLDLISGKGKGHIVLLHGPPGVGKTATAEAVAADLNRPLYPMSYADLGETPRDIDNNLKKIFRYGQRWDCVLLLDEADVFLMPRNLIDTARNGIVSVFLRNLEWYPGIIFLTTNRLDQFDEGVLDRVHLKLAYPPLKSDFIRNLCKCYLDRIEESFEPPLHLSDAEQKSYARRITVKKTDKVKIIAWWNERLEASGKSSALNGRKIKKHFQLALGYAESDMLENKVATAEVTVDHFKLVLAADEKFERDMRNIKEGIDPDAEVQK